MARRRHPATTDPAAALAATTAVRRLRLLTELELERYAAPPPPPQPSHRLDPWPVIEQRRRILNEALDGRDG